MIVYKSQVQYWIHVMFIKEPMMMVYQVLDEQNNPIAEHSELGYAQHDAETMTFQHADHYYHVEEVSIGHHWQHQLDAISITSISAIKQDVR